MKTLLLKSRHPAIFRDSIRWKDFWVLLRKVDRWLPALAALPLLFIVYLLRPILLIRFGPLFSRRIGHFAVNTELFLCEKEARLHRKRILDLFYHQSEICNQQLKKMWDRVLPVFPFVRFLDKANRCFPWYKKHVIPIPSDVDVYNLLERMPPHLSFTPDEERLGFKALQKLGIAPDENFICFYTRDPAYLERVDSKMNWNYQDYRDSQIQNCLPAAEELTKRGHHLLRMGAVVKEALQTTNPKIIDYASSGRTDFLDIFLPAKCRFFLGSTAGLSAIARIFRRPIAYINFIPMELQHLLVLWSGSLFIPKKLKYRNKDRWMTFRELLECGADAFYRGEQYEEFGIEVIENTPEEITALALEMEERLNGTWRTTEEDEELQQRFRAIFGVDPLQHKNRVRMGAVFLRNHRKLLD